MDRVKYNLRYISFLLLLEKGLNMVYTAVEYIGFELTKLDESFNCL